MHYISVRLESILYYLKSLSGILSYITYINFKYHFFAVYLLTKKEFKSINSIYYKSQLYIIPYCGFELRFFLILYIKLIFYKTKFNFKYSYYIYLSIYQF